MRRKGLWLSVLATAMMAGSASASSVTVASTLTLGGPFNWFTYNPVTALTEDWVEGNVGGVFNPAGIEPEPGLAVPGFGIHSAGTGTDTTSPGVGGQNFDLEQGFYGFNGDTTNGGILYIGIVTGFDPHGVRSGNVNYYSGDVFLNIGDTTVTPTAGYDYAFGTSMAGPDPVLDANDSPVTVQDTQRLGQAWNLSSPWTDASVIAAHATVSNPYRVASGGTPYVGNFQVAWIEDILGNGSDHNLLQVAVQLTGTQAIAIRDVGFGAHYTMSCGNDLLPISGKISVPNADIPVVPVPAAAPLGLLGMGLIALVRRVRRRTEC